jgi:hypothetical protein
MCYDTVSTYDISTLSLILNCTATSAFCMHGMHDTTYDTPIVGSLSFFPENMAGDGSSRVPEKQGDETGVRDWPGAQLFPLMRAQWNCRELLLAGATGVRRF